jgi:creatine kinase
MSSGPSGPSNAMQAGRWMAFAAGIYYGANRLSELREQRPKEVEAAQAALAKQMANEAAAKAKADADFANDSILYGTDAASRQAAIVKKILAIKESNPGNIAIASFDEAEFNSLSEADQGRLLKIMASGIGNPGSEMGCYAMGPTDYDDFYNFFKKALGRYHKVNLDEKKHSNDWELKGKEGLPADGVLDVSAFGISEPLSMRIRTARNLKKFPLAGAMTEEDRKNMELAMAPVFDALIAQPEFGGNYFSLTPGHKNHIDEAKYQELVKAHIMFKDMSADSFLVDAGIASHWPHGRGCYVSEDKGFIIWVGEEDHLRIMAMRNPSRSTTSSTD